MTESIMNHFSKKLSKTDDSGEKFVIEMLSGDQTFGINFDRIQWDNKIEKYVILEYLYCHPSQFERNITPFTSHPNRYFRINDQKFISLWRLTKKIDAQLILINYTSKNEKFEDEVLVMEVELIDPTNSVCPVKTRDKKMTRDEFSIWLRKLNSRGKYNEKY
tara:strand:+ start:93 stop:578 length:486 start_codon:yes stop_codon:yes gene_type:complete